MNAKNSKKEDKSISNYQKYNAGSTRVLIPPRPHELLAELRRACGESAQTLVDVAITLLYDRVMREGKLSVTIERQVNISLRK